MFLLGGTSSVTVTRTLWDNPAQALLNMCCQSTWSEPQAEDMAAHAAWIWVSLSSLACQVDCSLLQHTRTRTVMHNCMHACLLIGALRHFHTLCRDRQREREGCWACKPLITSTQIWYHCNRISDYVAYCISGFGQSSVTFVAEKWHGALVPNAITELASCTLRTVENTDTAERDGLMLGAAYACSSFVRSERVDGSSDWSSAAVTLYLIISANLKKSNLKKGKGGIGWDLSEMWWKSDIKITCDVQQLPVIWPYYSHFISGNLLFLTIFYISKSFDQKIFLQCVPIEERPHLLSLVICAFLC